MKQDADSATKYQERIMENNTLEQDTYFMKEALKEAKKAYLKDEVPVGCVIVKDNKIIARGHNTRHNNKSVFDHAEIVTIKKANKRLSSWMLDDTVMYVTLEPCLMCAGAIFQSRIKRVVYASKEPKFGSFGSILDLSNNTYKFNHHISITSGILEDESSLLLKEFFKKMREEKKQSKKSSN